MTDELFDELVQRVRATSDQAASDGRALQDQLTKPRGSLGVLEDLGVQLCAIAGSCPPPVPEPVTIAVFAGDHGVVAEGVTPWPQEVTAQMVANFCGEGAAINVIARHVGAEVVVVDVGVATSIPGPASGLLRRNVALGTKNLAFEAAMTSDEVAAALAVGVDVANGALARGAGLLVTGDMGIGNTTASAALIAALTGSSPEQVTGRGTGIDDETLARKIRVIESALARLGTEASPRRVLAELGGLEIAAMAGFIIAGAAARVPIVIDGVIAVAAALCAGSLAPASRSYLIAGHRSSAPGATVGLGHLELTPLLDLSLRLGEGSGAALAVPLVQAAAKILREMATFESAGVSDNEVVE